MGVSAYSIIKHLLVIKRSTSYQRLRASTTVSARVTENMGVALENQSHKAAVKIRLFICKL